MAVEDINAAGGVLGQKIELVTYDDQAKSDQAIFTANKLIGEDGVKLVVNGSYSASGRAAAPVFQKAGVVHDLGLWRASRHHARRRLHLPPRPSRTAAGRWRRRCISARRSASRKCPPSPWTMTTARRRWTGFSQRPANTASRLLNKYSYSLKDRQFGSIVASVKRDNPDAVYATGYFFTGGPLVAQLRAAGITAPIIGSQAFDSEKFVEIAGPAAEGTYIIDSFDRDAQGRGAAEVLCRVQEARRLRARRRRSHHLFGGDADGGRHQARQQRRSGEGARRACGDQELPIPWTATLNAFNSLHEILMPISVNVIKDGKFKPAGEITDLDAFAPPEK